MRYQSIGLATTYILSRIYFEYGASGWLFFTLSQHQSHQIMKASIKPNKTKKNIHKSTHFPWWLLEGEKIDQLQEFFFHSSPLIIQHSPSIFHPSSFSLIEENCLVPLYKEIMNLAFSWTINLLFDKPILLKKVFPVK